MPAYIAVVAATAAVIGWWYLAAAWFPNPGVGGITWAAWESHPLALVNASLWTLWPELCCYVLIALTPPRALPVVLPAAGAAVIAGAALAPGAMLSATIVVGPTIAFIVGAMIAVWQDRIPMSLPVGVVAAVARAVAALRFRRVRRIVGAAVAYLAIVVGLRLTLRWRTDLSYGTYLVAFPVTQVAYELGFGASGPLPLALISLAITIPVGGVELALHRATRAGARVPVPSRPSGADAPGHCLRHPRRSQPWPWIRSCSDHAVACAA